MARGLVLVVTRGQTITAIPKSFIALGNGAVAFVPAPVAVLAVLAVLTHLVLSRTLFGRRIYAVGGNEQAAALSGIRTRRVKFACYVLSSLLSAVTGVLFVARFNGAQADAGLGLELDAIAAAVIGGTSLMGGEGTVAGVLIGATIMGVIRNGLVLLGVSSYFEQLIIGAIIVLAAVLDILRRWRR
jgi:ribose transport system permease protein